MSEYAITFGFRFREETHPTVPNAHPYTYVVVEAETEEHARTFAVDELSPWAGIYDMSSEKWPDVKVHHPRGEVARYYVN